jgi:outer membrane protein assembly factor BamB
VEVQVLSRAFHRRHACGRPATLACGLGVALALAVAPAAAADVPDLWRRQTGSDWPTFLGPTGDGKSPETGFFNDRGLRGARILWQRDIDGGYAMPAVSRGRLFLFTRTDDRNRLDCLRAETGEPLWHFDYPTAYADLYGYDGGPRCAPVVDDDRVYIIGAEGMLHCLKVADGTVVWKVDTTATFGVVQNFFGVGGTPVVEGDLLLANIGGSPPESRDVPPGQLERVRGADSGVVAFDKRSGAVRYQFSDELASYASPVLATIGDRRWGFVFARGGLVGFDPATGRQDFHFPWRAKIRESVNAANPVVVGAEVLISETYGPGSALLRVAPGASTVVWQDDAAQRRKIFQAHWSTPIHHEGHLYGCSGRHLENAELRCIEWKTGRVAWSQPGLGRTSLLLVDGHFFCLTEGGDLLVLRATPEKFDQIAEIPLLAAAPAPGDERVPLLTYPAWAAPILAHGLLYVRGADRLVCLELDRGD